MSASPPHPSLSASHPARGTAVDAALRAVYSWDYEPEIDQLRTLYANGLERQWIALRDLDWERGIDREAVTRTFSMGGIPVAETRFWQELPLETRWRLSRATAAFMLSQFLHGEQGALIVASQLVGGVPWIDAKYYAGSQTMDVARHVEVFSRYLREKLEWEWPINPQLKELLDATLKDSRWDFKYLGMQIMIEGLAMAAFGNLYQLCQEPLLKKLLLYVMRDESRHVTFGVVSLRDYYKDMPANELADREDFIIYSAELMRNRLVGSEIARTFGWNQDEVRDLVLGSPVGKAFRSILFQRVVPNLKRLGLLTPRVRDAFEKLDILKFENEDPEKQDRELGFAS